MQNININGKSFSISGNSSISIINGALVVNGEIIQEGLGSPTNIVINADVKDLTLTSGDVTVNGDIAGNLHLTSGDVNVSGNICGDVRVTSGDIQANSIQGITKTTNGDICTKN